MKNFLSDKCLYISFILSFLAIILLFFGLFKTCLTITPHLNIGILGGDILQSKIWKILQEAVKSTDWASSSSVLTSDPKSYSILGGIKILFTTGEFSIGVILLIFSVLFPISKLIILLILNINILIANKADSNFFKTGTKWLGYLGKWSMLDVLVLALFVLSFKEFPGGTVVRLESGVYFFATSVLLSIFAAIFLESTLKMKDT